MRIEELQIHVAAIERRLRRVKRNNAALPIKPDPTLLYDPAAWTANNVRWFDIVHLGKPWGKDIEIDFSTSFGRFQIDFSDSTMEEMFFNRMSIGNDEYINAVLRIIESHNIKPSTGDNPTCMPLDNGRGGVLFGIEWSRLTPGVLRRISSRAIFGSTRNENTILNCNFRRKKLAPK